MFSAKLFIILCSYNLTCFYVNHESETNIIQLYSEISAKHVKSVNTNLISQKYLQNKYQDPKFTLVIQNLKNCFRIHEYLPCCLY